MADEYINQNVIYSRYTHLLPLFISVSPTKIPVEKNNKNKKVGWNRFSGGGGVLYARYVNDERENNVLTY